MFSMEPYSVAWNVISNHTKQDSLAVVVET